MPPLVLDGKDPVAPRWTPLRVTLTLLHPFAKSRVVWVLFSLSLSMTVIIDPILSVQGFGSLSFELNIISYRTPHFYSPIQLTRLPYWYNRTNRSHRPATSENASVYVLNDRRRGSAKVGKTLGCYPKNSALKVTRRKQPYFPLLGRST